MLNYSSPVTKLRYIKFGVNCLRIYGKSLYNCIIEECVHIIEFYYSFKKRFAHMIFILAITVLLNRIFAVWRPNSSQLVRPNTRTSPKRNVCWKHHFCLWDCMGKPEAVNLSSFTGIWPFCDINLCLHPFKIQRSQEVNITVFVDWVLEHLEVDPNFYLIFRRMDIWTRTTVAFWTTQIHRETYQYQMHFQKVPVWYELWILYLRNDRSVLLKMKQSTASDKIDEKQILVSRVM